MSGEDLKSSQLENKVPGRTVGFFVMSAIIVFVAIWMSIQGNDRALTDLSEQSKLENYSASLPSELRLANLPLLGFVEVEAGEFLMGSNPLLDLSLIHI